MPKFRVYLINTASYVAEVEAEDEDEAINLAFEEAPYENISNDFELADWYLPSEAMHGQIDVELIEED